MAKPNIGGYYALSNGRKGRIMAVELAENGYYLGHDSFSEWFKRHTKYRITVAFQADNGNIRSEKFEVDK